ncbi:MAG: LuxR C-terminal-related transcriptional regulator [Oscillospiraceae bacterium]|jgi:LuxR family maltose regulon positive regulatory protein|nr:LuxR C-terminal-related transcriptional regulator [Oscillospiraceae bacterium]
MPGSFFTRNTAIMSGRQAYLERPHIHNLMRRAIQSALVTVVAGPGFGKTQAVDSFLRTSGAVTFWLPLAAADNLTGRFWDTFTRAFAAYDRAFAARMKALGFPETETQLAQYRALSGAQSEARHVIVFDDFHLIREPAILRFVEVAAAPFQNVSVILISRSEPAVNLISPMARGQLFQIGEEDLRFREDEMLRYFWMLGITLSPQAAAGAYAATEGWAFAVSLLALALKNDPAGEAYALSAMRLNLFKLIEAEIFSVAPAPLQHFLIGLSLLDRLPMELLRALAPEESLPAQIGRMSFLIRYDSHTDAYRIHHLFLTFLHQKQSLLTPEERRSVYAKAARWCAANDYAIDAVTYYEKAGDYRGLAETAYPMTRMTPRRDAEYLLALLEKLPEHAYRDHVELYIIKNKTLQSLSRFEEAAAEAREIIRRYEPLPPTQTHCWLLSECHLQLGYIGLFTALYTNILDHSYHCEMGYRYFQLSGGMTRGPTERTLISSYVNRVAYPAERGCLTRAQQIYARYAHYVTKAKNGMLYGTEALTAAEIAFFKNDLKNAESLSLRAANQAREREQFQVETRGLFFLLRIALHAGDAQKARRLLARLEALRDHPEFLHGDMRYDIATGWFFAQIGRLDEIAAWLKNDFAKPDLNSLHYGLEKIVRAKYHMAEKRYHLVLTFLENREALRGVEDFLIGKLELTVLRAVCLYHTGDRPGALRALAEARTIARCEDLDMPFVEMGRDMRTLAAAALADMSCADDGTPGAAPPTGAGAAPTDASCADDGTPGAASPTGGARAAPADASCALSKTWLENIHRKSSAYAKKLTLFVKDYRAPDREELSAVRLSPREREVLSSLAQGLTRAEIAAALYLSDNTVKGIIKSIYNKLGAVNRADAVRIAADMRLIGTGQPRRDAGAAEVML